MITQQNIRFPLISIVIFGLFAAYFTFMLIPRPKPLPVLGAVPDFQLLDSRNQNFSKENLKDKVWVADFIFTTCAGPCPILSSQMAKLQGSFSKEPRVRFVSFTVNPEVDTPEVLSKYAGLLGAETSRWHFLTGPKERIHKLAVEGFKLGSVENPVFHSTYLILVDGESRIRGYYEATDQEQVRKLRKDLSRLIKKGGS